MLIRTEMARPLQIFVPVQAVGNVVRDNGGDMICQCFTPEMAAKVAELINRDAGLGTSLTPRLEV